jgi:hypothetical protein
LANVMNRGVVQFADCEDTTNCFLMMCSNNQFAASFSGHGPFPRGNSLPHVLSLLFLC